VSRSPDIWLPPGIQNLVTKIHDHDEEWRRKGTYIDCQDPGCRTELLLRGGVECVKKQWFVARDVYSVSIPQPDGFTHQHMPGLREHKDKSCTDEKCSHDVSCSSPSCNEFFQSEWDRCRPRGGDPYYAIEGAPRPVAAPTAELRPRSGAELDVAEREFANEVRHDVEVDRQIAERRRWRPTPIPTRR
jgi:hypothetical protein